MTGNLLLIFHGKQRGEIKTMKTELLAPAGSYEAMTAAFAAGADAVYIGGQKFGARAYADNLDTDQMMDAIAYARLHGKKLYLTVNTLLKERELEEELYDYLLPFYEQGLDAVIVQDFGVFSLIRNTFPDLAVHCSTQMTITGPFSAALLESLGASRIVTARELSLEEIRKIRRQTKLEIESFVHGALCYCYSGQCLFSSMLGGRSGNRGRCAQPCRLPYQVFEKGRQLNGKNSAYPLSPKDMCTIDLLPEIIRSGVTSLKIEGRMKRPEYTAGVVRIYRKYLDQFLSGHWTGVSKEDQRELYDLYNRDGFHQGYYFQRNGRNMMALKNEKASANKKSSHNDRLFEELFRKYVSVKDPVPVSLEVVLKKGEPARITAKACDCQVFLEGNCVSPARNQPLCRERVEKQLKKTGGTCFSVAGLSLEMEEDIFLPLQELNEIRRTSLNSLEEKIIKAGRRKSPLHGKASFIGKNQAADTDLFFSVSVHTQEQAKAALHVPQIRRIYGSWQIFDETFIEKCKKYGKEPWLTLPLMVREPEMKQMREMVYQAEDAGAEGYLAHIPEQYAWLRSVGLERKTVLDGNLSSWNRRGSAFFDCLGMEGDTVPPELNEKEIWQRNNFQSELVVYGYTPLMISAQCVKKNLDRCTRRNSTLWLKDRYQKNFCVQCSCDYCYNTIYNSLPLNLTKEIAAIRKLPVRGFRLCFTMEDKKTTSARIEEFLSEYQSNRAWNDASGDSTKGHFRRGV